MKQYPTRPRTLIFMATLLVSGSNILLAHAQMSDIPLISPNVESIDVYKGTNISLTCTGSTPVAWRYQKHLERQRSSIHEKFSKKTYQYVSMLTITNIDFLDFGTYECRYTDISPELSVRRAFIHLSVLGKPQILEKPVIQSSIFNVIHVGDGFYLDCLIHTHVTVLTLTWIEPRSVLKSGRAKVEVENLSLRRLQKFRRRLLVVNATKEDGKLAFVCKASYSNGHTVSIQRIRVLEPGEKFLNVTQSKSFKFCSSYFLICACASAVLLALPTYLIIKCRKKQKIKQMQNSHRQLVEDSSKGGLCLTEQDDTEIAHDSEIEFPRSQLKLGTQLGAGAFGRVMKGEATGIFSADTVSIVAVKMVKKNAKISHIEALMSELKILTQVGKHANVVNLLGACTTQIKKGELLVIVEYCKYGSLLSYLLHNKYNFIDQLNHATGIIAKNGKIADAICSTEQIKSRMARCYVSPEYANQNECRTGAAASLSRTKNPGGKEMLNTDEEKNYDIGWHKSKESYEYTDDRPITTIDLLSWCFQISRGMEYLASKKILHGDLAARNVLLAEKNIVKICDFGLATQMKCKKYIIMGTEVPLPIKWMAIESILYRVFSKKSDVWSFGVLMWELFTLGDTPYPDMELDDRFSKLLSDGYRLHQPVLAPDPVYNIMFQCWEELPLERPRFSDIRYRLGNILQESQLENLIQIDALTTASKERMKVVTYDEDLETDIEILETNNSLSCIRMYSNLNCIASNRVYMYAIPDS